MTTNDELLERYIKERAESAFKDLVTRHLDLVYSTALRHVRSPHLAQEVAQLVFIDLAHQCGRIKPGTPLVAWLHVVARRTAFDVIRKESCRRSYENKAAEIMSVEGEEADTSTKWEDIQPLVDEALESLRPIDRAAILLRFFEDKSFQQVAAVLGSTDDAAQKRVSRALEQLRQFLTRKGVSVTAAGLSARLATNAIQAAPSSLAPAIVATVLEQGATLANLITPLSKIAMTSTQKILLTTVFAASLAGGLYQAQEISRERTQVKHLRERAQLLERDIDNLRTQREAAEKTLAEMSDALAAERAKTALLPSQDPQAESALDAWLHKVVKLKEHLKQNARYRIPEFALLEEKDWLDATKNIQLEDDWDYRAALATLRSSAKYRLFGQLHPAVARFLKASNGKPPSDPSQLAAYMDKQVDPGIWQRYHVIKSKDASGDLQPFTRANGQLVEWLITEKAVVDEYYDGTFFLSENGYGSAGAWRYNQEIFEAQRSFKSAHSDQRPTTASQLAPYLRSTIDPAFIERQLKVLP